MFVPTFSDCSACIFISISTAAVESVSDEENPIWGPAGLEACEIPGISNQQSLAGFSQTR